MAITFTVPISFCLSKFYPKPHLLNLNPHFPSLQIPLPRTTKINFHGTRSNHTWNISAATDDPVLPPPDTTTTAIINSVQDQMSGETTVIQVLLFSAFVALSILTIGVIYIGVTDFLQKREKEKFEKEEAANKKKTKKKIKTRARSGPRGFGQKRVEEDDDKD